MSSANGKESRGLSSKFIEDLGKGHLSSLVDLVKRDSSLSLEMRNGYINVYYRGGNLLRLEEIKEHVYSAFFDKNYLSSNSSILNELPHEIHSASEVDRWRANFPALKVEMDQWFSNNPKAEREFQQIVVWENNDSSIANYTDYFIVDIEYDNKRGGRFNMVAIRNFSASLTSSRLHDYF
ncbi:MAG: hypothetical protein A3D87_02290 [Omnitrophica WOR_2 bacterium RIFCSPHIGHO2_02_FULL_50_17]|nr:MAG: hypothetical protein A3D87_02290 [Omnitrophica WOR_2 bacterium RIFCSPHIGHO2_02_FULL_50_17]